MADYTIVFAAEKKKFTVGLNILKEFFAICSGLKPFFKTSINCVY